MPFEPDAHDSGKRFARPAICQDSGADGEQDACAVDAEKGRLERLRERFALGDVPGLRLGSNEPEFESVGSHGVAYRGKYGLVLLTRLGN